MSSTSKHGITWRRGGAERLASFAAALAITALALLVVASFIGREFGGSTVVSVLEQLIKGEPFEGADRSIGGERSSRAITFAH